MPGKTRPQYPCWQRRHQLRWNAAACSNPNGSALSHRAQASDWLICRCRWAVGLI
jgi:hypothetical protein